MSRVSELKEKLREAMLEQRLARAKACTTAMESFSMWDGDRGRIVQPRADIEPDALTLTPQQIRDGAHEAFRTEQELWAIQAAGEILGTRNGHCVGLLLALTNYVIGGGFNYKCTAKNANDEEAISFAKQGDNEIEAFSQANLWPEWERELFNRSRRHGEAFLRFFDSGDVLQVRGIEPRMVVNPTHATPGDGWSFGVRTDPEDQQMVLAYWVSLNMDAGSGEEVDAEDILHIRCNVDRVVRRGLSDFFCIASESNSIKKLLGNMSQSAAMLAAIAWIEQFSGTTQAGVESFAQSMRTATATDPRNGSTINFENTRPGAIVRTGMGKEYKAPPLASANTTNFVEILRAGRQTLAARWNAPESLTGDASNGTYASLAVAESPFVLNAENEQVFYQRRYEIVIRRAINYAITLGRLPSDFWSKVKLTVEGRPLIVRNKLETAQVNTLELQAGVLSRKTWCQENGRDWETEAANIEAEQARGYTVQPQPGMAPTTEGVDFFELWKRLVS